MPSQGLADWIRAHVGMLTYFGGVPHAIVPDNLRAAVVRSSREPVLNRTYADMARYYSTVILPARAYHPKDKAKVEVGVKIAQRWILARLRHRTFFSLAELNQAISELLEELNRRPFKRLPGCRRERFEQAERSALQALPSEPYVYAEWFAAQRVGPDYHVNVQGHWYSVPHQLVGQAVESRVSADVVELFHGHQRIAAHVRQDVVGAHTTNPAHMPAAHRAQAGRTPEHYLEWAERIGPNALAVVRHQFDRTFPMLAIPACEALYRLSRQYDAQRLEAAAKRAVEIRSLTVKSVKSLLTAGSRTGAPVENPAQDPPRHDNLRGADYYSMPGDSSC